MRYIKNGVIIRSFSKTKCDADDFCADWIIQVLVQFIKSLIIRKLYEGVNVMC